MYKIGDKIILNKKREDCPMISGEESWNNSINRQIVAILSPYKFLVRMLWCEREEVINIDDIKCRLEDFNCKANNNKI